MIRHWFLGRKQKKKQVITEEMHLEAEWYDQASKQTCTSLPAFIDHVMNDYVHDYGTVCHAIAACAIAAAWAANNDPGGEGGITGFQAGIVMWFFIRQWIHKENKTGLKLLDYDDLLYPQCEYKFEKIISADVWESLKDQAQKKLQSAAEHASPAVIDHWRSIAEGNPPFGFAIKEK